MGISSSSTDQWGNSKTTDSAEGASRPLELGEAACTDTDRDQAERAEHSLHGKVPAVGRTRLPPHDCEPQRGSCSSCRLPSPPVAPAHRPERQAA